MTKDHQLLSIGETSRIMGLTVKVLRFYDRLSLVKPYTVDPVTKYRYYSTDQLLVLEVVKAARSLGVSPNDLKRVFDTEVLLEFLEREKVQGLEKLADLWRKISSMSSVQRQITCALSSVEQRGIYRREIPTRQVITISLTGQESSKELIAVYSAFYPMIEKHQLVNQHETGILLRYHQDRYQPAYLFNSATCNEESITAKLYVIEGGVFSCVCCRPENVEEQLQKLERHLAENGVLVGEIIQMDLLDDLFSPSTGSVEFQVRHH